MSFEEHVVRGNKVPLRAGAPVRDDSTKPQRSTGGSSGSHPRYEDAKDNEYKGYGRVLVVDDEPSVARLTSLILEQCGFEVSVAASGAEALAIIGSDHEPLRLVLMDYSLPDYDGRAVLAAARELGCHVPMILTTGYPKEPDAGPPEGFSGFLQKPYRFDTLVGALRRVLGD